MVNLVWKTFFPHLDYSNPQILRPALTEREDEENQGGSGRHHPLQAQQELKLSFSQAVTTTYCCCYGLQLQAFYRPAEQNISQCECSHSRIAESLTEHSPSPHRMR